MAHVVERGTDAGEHATFDVRFERTPLGMDIVIREKGMPFDPAKIPEYRRGDSLEGQETTGIGAFLMKEIMDKVTFSNLGMGGQEVRMSKHLQNRNIEEMMTPAERNATEAEPPVAKPRGVEGKIEYDVRRLNAEEAIEVSKCAYKSHGYTFFDDHIYYPDRIVELNESGEMVSAVAVTKENVFMGHAALVYPYPGQAYIAELTFVFVNVEFRSQGCMNRLCEFLFNPKKYNQPYRLDGVYAYAVTNHVFTQKVMVKYEINDCGLLLATSPATWIFKGIDGDASQRISVVLSYKYLTPPVPVKIYAPPRHREMIGKLYANIGGKPEFVEPPAGTKPPEQDSAIETRVFASEQCGEIELKKPGRHVVKEVRGILRDLCIKQIASIQLFLNLEDPLTASLCAEFERLGFFFAGILPGAAIGDTLILQYLNNVPFDYGKLRIHTEMGKELTAYIKGLDPNVA